MRIDIQADWPASSASEPKNDLWRCVETVDCLMTTTTWPSGKLLYESRPNRLIAYRGTRVGEAKNPGPTKPATFQISVVNPTSVYDKAKLITDTGNLVLMSETSATEKIQSIERNKFRSCGHHVIRGDPVPSMKQVAHETQAFCTKHISKIRGPSKPMVTCVSKFVPLRVTRLRANTKGKQPLRLLNPIDFRKDRTTYLEGKPIVANLVRHDAVVLETSDHNVPVGPIRIEQRYEVYEPSQLQGLFDQYWSCYWKRDSYQEQTQDDLWVPFMQHLQQLPSPNLQIHIDMDDMNQWKEAINKMKSNSARGVCGWSPPELKMLPDRALRHLIDIPRGSQPVGLTPCLYHEWSRLPRPPTQAVHL